MKYRSTVFLRFAVWLFGIGVLALCVFVLPKFTGWFAQDAKRITGFDLFPLAAAWMYAPGLPFFLALYQAWKLLGYVDKNMAFSEKPAKALNSIKYCAAVMSVFYFAGMPFVYLSAQVEDAPGMVLIAAVFAASPLVIAAFASFLRHLLEEAVRLCVRKQ